MVITATGGKIHWNYYLALEHDMENAARYVEFCDDNMETYSIEFGHLLLASSSEVDALAKLLCGQLDQDAPRANMDNYRDILFRKLEGIAELQVEVPRYGLTLNPWTNWTDGRNPDWWRSYNNVKHERDTYFREATLRNSLNCLAGLLCLTFHYYHLATHNENPEATAKHTTLSLRPESSLLNLAGDYYFSSYVG